MPYSADDIHALAMTMLGEARDQGAEGMLAVGHVVQNRADATGATPDEVTRQYVGDSDYSQFSFVDDANLATAQRLADANDPAYQEALELAAQVLSGTSIDPTAGALYYHTSGVTPDWMGDYMPTTTIGAHQFYGGDLAAQHVQAINAAANLRDAFTVPETSAAFTLAQNLPGSDELRTASMAVEATADPFQVGITPAASAFDSRAMTELDMDFDPGAMVAEAPEVQPDGVEVAGDFSVLGFAPVAEAARFSSPFGMREHPITGDYTMHAGQDLAGGYGISAAGMSATAMGDGTVTFAGQQSGYGNRIVIEHANGLETAYNHLESIDVAVGDQVLGGNPIGAVGSTGASTGPHLHVEVRKDGVLQDPAPMLATTMPGGIPTLGPVDPEVASLDPYAGIEPAPVPGASIDIPPILTGAASQSLPEPAFSAESAASPVMAAPALSAVPPAPEVPMTGQAQGPVTQSLPAPTVGGFPDTAYSAAATAPINVPPSFSGSVVPPAPEPSYTATQTAPLNMAAPPSPEALWQRTNAFDTTPIADLPSLSGTAALEQALQQKADDYTAPSALPAKEAIPAAPMPDAGLFGSPQDTQAALSPQNTVAQSSLQNMKMPDMTLPGTTQAPLSPQNGPSLIGKEVSAYNPLSSIQTPPVNINLSSVPPAPEVMPSATAAKPVNVAPTLSGSASTFDDPSYSTPSAPMPSGFGNLNPSVQAAPEASNYLSTAANATAAPFVQNLGDLSAAPMPEDPFAAFSANAPIGMTPQFPASSTALPESMPVPPTTGLPGTEAVPAAPMPAAPKAPAPAAGPANITTAPSSWFDKLKTAASTGVSTVVDAAKELPQQLVGTWASAFAGPDPISAALTVSTNADGSINSETFWNELYSNPGYTLNSGAGQETMTAEASYAMGAEALKDSGLYG